MSQDLSCTVDCEMEHVHSFERSPDWIDWVAVIAMLKEPRHSFLLAELRELARDKA